MQNLNAALYMFSFRNVLARAAYCKRSAVWCDCLFTLEITRGNAWVTHGHYSQQPPQTDLRPCSSISIQTTCVTLDSSHSHCCRRACLAWHYAFLLALLPYPPPLLASLHSLHYRPLSSSAVLCIRFHPSLCLFARLRGATSLLATWTGAWELCSEKVTTCEGEASIAIGMYTRTFIGKILFGRVSWRQHLRWRNQKIAPNTVKPC